VSAEKRAASMPQVPTTLEAGLPADSIYPFYSGLFMHAKTPRAIIEKLHQETAKAMQAPSVQERFKQLGVEPMPMTVAQFEKFFRDDVDAAVALVKAADIPRQ
jgi:tripartite-type tricarboxylate transporter receptor subunit TctC